MPKLHLARVLKKRRLSKRQFALRVGVHYSQVFRFFRPQYDPKFSMLVRWSKALGLKVRDLLRELYEE